MMTQDQRETTSNIIKQMQDFLDMHDADLYLIEVHRARLQQWISRLEEVEGKVRWLAK